LSEVSIATPSRIIFIQRFSFTFCRGWGGILSVYSFYPVKSPHSWTQSTVA
jgi:hypothetical protein